MSEFNQELVRALANGDQVAQESIKDLPTPLKMALGLEVDKLRQTENIIPMTNGFAIYEKQQSKYSNDKEVAKALAERIKQQKENEELKEKVRQEFLEKEIKAKVERTRAGLAMTDRR